jgi:hypothetical protein
MPVGIGMKTWIPGRSEAGVGINGTPFFFINGRVIAGAQPFGNFRRVIEEELKK